MKCPKCGGSNEAAAAFCVSCGAKLGKEKSLGENPAKQAEMIGKKFSLVIKKLTLGEKLIGIGAILGLISFFLTWLSVNENIATTFSIPEKMRGKDFSGWLYLLPILMLVSLVLLYFLVGATEKLKLNGALTTLLLAHFLPPLE